MTPPTHDERRGQDDAPPFGRRADDSRLRELEARVHELSGDAAPRHPFWKRWTVGEWAAFLGILGGIFGGGLGVARWVAHTASAPVVQLRSDFNDFARGTAEWREGFANEIRDVRFDVCVAGRPGAESECVRTVYRTTPGQQRVDSTRRAPPPNP